MTNPKVILTILDGWGIAPAGPGNGITLADPTNYKSLLQNYPHSQLEASGIAVGLPADQDGNTETGHLNIGAGRIVYQDLARINLSIANGSFFNNPAFIQAIKHVQGNHSTLHLLGLVGSSGVHAFNEHIYALIMLAVYHHLDQVNLHLITDGRDSPPFDALDRLKEVESYLTRYHTGKIVSLMGRYYAMDRDLRLDRTQQAFTCLTGDGAVPNFSSAAEAIQASYDQNLSDEFVKPLTVGPDPGASRIKANDAVIFFNYRIDRPRQLTKMLLDARIPNLNMVTMTKYHSHFNASVAFPDIQIKNSLGEVIAAAGLRQLRAAESEKERFVTYYFNGQREDPFPGEERLIVPSPHVATYDLAPAMSTKDLIAQFCQKFSGGDFSLGILNIACPDMVAHTGNIPKTIEAILAADSALGLLMQLATQTNSYLLITCDHGNAEELLNQETGKMDTQHSLFPVPFIIYGQDVAGRKLSSGVLADIAPTILALLNLSVPSDMTGTNLLQP